MDIIDDQFEEMCSLVIKWSVINSHCENQEGVSALLEELELAFSRLKPDEKVVTSFKKTRGLWLKKRGDAPIQIYCGGHLDTVFPKNHSFQQVTLVDSHILKGPGVADMKGGLVVLLKALEFFETSEACSNVGWEIFINGDEEIGSPESTPFIKGCAKRMHAAFLFEPCFEEGVFVSRRKGSANFQLISLGKKAHAGRDSHLGKNAIFPLAHAISELESWSAKNRGALINVGWIKGGESHNIIPDYAECHLNIRADQNETALQLEQDLHNLAHRYGLLLKKSSSRPPKPFDCKNEALFQALKKCGQTLGMDITWRESGGVCDGNTLAALGLPTIDTLGVQGGKLHTSEEYLMLKSLTEKTKLTALLFHEIAKGNILLCGKMCD